MMRFFTIGTVVVVVGCSGGSDRSTEAYEVFDSAGVQIVNSNAPIRGPGEGWAVSNEPVLEISTDPQNPDLVIHWVRGVVRLSDRRIAAISESSSDLKLFDSRGYLEGLVGRRGHGPGEFRRPFQLTRLPGDTLVVTERGGRNSYWYSQTGEFLHSTTHDRTIGHRLVPGGFSLGAGRFVPPHFVLTPVNEIEYPDRLVTGRRWRNPKAYMLTEADGTDPVLIGWFQGGEKFYLEVGVGRGAFFPRNTWVASGGDPPHIYIGDSESFDIKIYDTSARLVRILRDEVPPPPIDKEDIEWERRDLLDYAAHFGWTERYLRLADAMVIPDRRPAFEALIVDSEGFLWAKEYSGPRPGPVRYRIYSPDGGRVGTVGLPGRLTVYDIGSDFVLGLYYDLDYVETIQMFDLTRPGH